MMDLSPTDLRNFFEVAKTNNISRAAEGLGIGQPALSQALRRLEHGVGVRLLDRFKTGVQLTAAGQRMLREGRLALEQWARLKDAALAADRAVEGRYSIGCHPSVGVYALPNLLRDLLARHPGLEVSLRHGLSREVLEDVVSFRVDFGLVINPARHPDLIIRPLCEDRVRFWQLKGASPDTLIYDPALFQVQALLKKLGAKESFRRHLHSSSLEVIASLAESGTGVAILPERIARRYPRLQPAKGALPSVRDQLCLVYRADRHLTAAARVILDAVAGAKI